MSSCHSLFVSTVCAGWEGFVPVSLAVSVNICPRLIGHGVFLFELTSQCVCLHHGEIKVDVNFSSSKLCFTSIHIS